MSHPGSRELTVEHALWPLKAAAEVSWRACVLALALLVLPLIAALWVLSVLGESTVALSVAIAVVCYPISLYAHELGHLCGVLWFAPQTLSSLKLKGQWRRARLERSSAGALEDACISIVGPVAGLLTMLPVVFLPANPIFLLPWVLLFHSHVFALAPWSSDGRQILQYFQRGDHVTSG